MMRLRSIPVLFFSLLIMLTSGLTKAQHWTLVWSDEFDSTQLNGKYWNIEVTGNPSNNELEYYTSRPENLRLENGNLVIEARKENYLGKQYTSARINTQNKVYWKYGRIEARMKLPYGKGMWPAFWMLGQSISTKGWPDCGEMDIMEMIGGGANDGITHGTLHWGPLVNGSHPSSGSSWSLPYGKFADAFHVFAEEWNPQSVSIFVDDVKYFTLDITDPSMAAFHDNFFMILNLAVGGDWPGSPDASTVFPQELLVDYVRVYASIAGEQEVVKKQSGLIYSLPYNAASTYLWSVPAGASVTGAADSNTVQVDWGCDTGTVSCKVTTGSKVVNYTLPVTVKDYAISGTSYFVPSSPQTYTFIVPESAGTTYSWAVPAEDTITSGQGTNSVDVNWGTSPGKVSLTITNSCDTVTVERKVLAPGLYAYPDPNTPHAIPGTIQATDYNYGGEGLAYHDADAANQGGGSRQDQGVDTEGGDGGEDVGWTSAGEWLTYMVKVAGDGEYYPELRVASQSGGGRLSILFNGVEKVSNYAIPSTGSWSNFTSVYPGLISLSNGDTLMRYNIVSSGFNLGRIIFWEKDTIAPTMPSNLTGTPGAGRIDLSWEPASDNQKLKGYAVFLDGQYVATAAGPYYTLTGLTPGTAYRVGIVATDIQNNTSDTLTGDFTTLTTGIHAAAESRITLYPNPAGDVLHIPSNRAGELNVLVLNMLGQRMIRKVLQTSDGDYQLDISGLKPGMYFLLVRGNGSWGTYAFVKR